MKYLTVVFLSVFLVGCAAPGFNKTVNVTVLGTHHIYEVPKDSEIEVDGKKTKIKEDSILTSKYYFSKILRAKVNFKDKQDEETISTESINQ